MKVRKILLTGDDGYNSIGTRLLIYYLKNRYDLFIAGTQVQQSGVGGYVNVGKDIRWKEIEVDGVKGLAVNGTPADAVEATYAYCQRKFDLVISGINVGANIGGAFFSSGTIAAFIRAHFIGVAEKGITISQLTLDPKTWIHDHSKTKDITSFQKYPGEVAFKVIMKSIRENLCRATLLNINLPGKKSSEIRFTKPIYDLTQFYSYPGKINHPKRIYRYPMSIINKKFPVMYDIGALHEGYISISPCVPDLLNEEIYRKLKDKTFSL